MTITPDQLIMRAKQYIFHIKCFKCIFCDKNLNTGDEYGIKESAILCRNHFYNDMDTNETTVKFEPFNNFEFKQHNPTHQQQPQSTFYSQLFSPNGSTDNNNSSIYFNLNQTQQQPQPQFDPNNNNNNNYNYNIEDENREDLKLTLLEKIDNLTEELEDEGVSLDKIPKVDYTSNLEQIEYVAKLLMLKANRNRYASLGEEFILALASGLEMLCNGDREFLGIRPDLNGYSDVVKVKLRRLRNETSQVVGNVVEKYEISPITTLLIELIPSLFLHSKRRKNQSYDNLYNDLSDDINEISKFN